MTDELLGHPAVREALGGSLVAEELRGDFTRARQAASAAGVLEICLVDSITGRSGAARRRLAELTSGALDTAQQAVVTRLRLFADALYFRNTPAHIGMMFDDLEPRWDRKAALNAATGSLSLAGPVTAREIRLLSIYDDLLGDRRALMFRGGAQPRDVMVLSPEVLASGSGPLVALTLTLAHGRLSALAEQLDSTSPRPCSPSWIALAEADLFRRAGNPVVALERIQAERTRCERIGDWHGSALCLVAEGDTRGCVIESPMTLGLSFHYAINNEQREHARVSDIELAAARAVFLEAQERFAKADAPRGVAAVQLRLAGVAALAGDHAEARERANRAELASLACGDEAQGHLAHIHAVLAHIAEMLPVDVERIREIGAWGTGDGDLGFALGLGCLLSRAARRWLLRDAGYEQSVRCSQLAEELLVAAGAPLAAAEAVGEQFSAHAAIRDRAAAFVAAQRADDLFSSVGPGSGGGVPVLGRRLMLQHAAWSLALAASDATSMDVFAGRLAQAVGEFSASFPSAGEVSASVPLVDALLALHARAADMAKALDADGSLAQRLADAESKLGTDSQAELMVVMLANMANETIRVSTTMAPQYRAYDLELDPAVGEERREQAWRAAAAALDVWPEPEHWLYAGLLQAARGDRASGADTCERYFAVGPSPSSDLEPGDLPEVAEIKYRAKRNRLRQALMTFVRLADASRARQALTHLVALDGEDWWKSDNDPWGTLAYLGDLQRMERDAAGALATYERAREILEQQRAMLRNDGAKTAFADSRSAQRLFGYAALVALDVAPPLHERAFDFIECGRARALADLVSDVRVTTGGTAPLGRWRQACAQRDLFRALISRALAADKPDAAEIARLQVELDEREAAVIKLEAGAREKSPRQFQVLDARAGISSLAEVAARIPDRAVVIELSLIDRTLLGWALTRDGMVVTVHRELENDRLVRRDVRGFLQACADNSRSLAAGQRLAGVLLAPFGDAIRAASQVVFVAAGDLSLVPFHALPFDGDALGAQVSVSYAPSA
ncbi:MAG: hypothetical protein H7138_09265, partial [Myxococcales bacterium]|nr:hypothetical protein [Myxococcales bacterium]